ncbi:MAG: hypothetical protein IIY58_02065 [Aeriscardovia sp.]|nr:hypothetical protein [Aeriscardovia sp.]
MTPLGELYYNHYVKPLEVELEKGKKKLEKGEKKIRKQEEELRELKKGQQFTHELILRTVNLGLEKGEKLEEILEAFGISQENYAEAIQYQTEKEKKELKKEKPDQ